MGFVVFSDIDNTIKPKVGNFSQKCIESVKRFVAAGNVFVLTTGRNRSKTEEYAQRFGGFRYIINSNGGEVFDTVTRQSIFASEIARENIEKLFQISQKNGFRLVLNVDADFRFASKRTRFDDTEREFSNLDEVFGKYKVVGGFFIGIPDDLVEEMKNKIYGIRGITVANYGIHKGENYIDFASEVANKGVAVKKLMQHLQTNYDDTISIGDGLNDLPMFSATKRSVAVSNAVEGLKGVADVVVESVDNDGVAKFLDSLIK